MDELFSIIQLFVHMHHMQLKCLMHMQLKFQAMYKGHMSS